MGEPSKEPINKDVPREAASSAASPTASEASERSFVADPGPAFDAEAAASRPAPEPAAPSIAEPQLELEEWEEEVISSLLGVQGRVLHAAAGVAEDDWLYTEIDLAAICPPLTRICNRYPAIRQYARHADPVAVAIALGAYGTRSLIERRQVLAARAGEETEVTIEPLDPGGTPPQGSPPAPPPPPSPSSFPAGGGVTQAPAPSAAKAPVRPPRPGEAQVEASQLDWQVERG